jgi:hypothetical protein
VTLSRLVGFWIGWKDGTVRWEEERRGLVRFWIGWKDGTVMWEERRGDLFFWMNLSARTVPKYYYLLISN